MVNLSKALKIVLGSALLSSPLISCTGEFSKYQFNRNSGKFEYNGRAFSKLELTRRAGSDYDYDIANRKFCLNEQKRNEWLQKQNSYVPTVTAKRNQIIESPNIIYRKESTINDQNEIPSYLDIVEKQQPASTPIIDRTFKPQPTKVELNMSNNKGQNESLEDTFLAGLPKTNTSRSSNDINLFATDINLDQIQTADVVASKKVETNEVRYPVQEVEPQQEKVSFGSMATKPSLHQKALEARVVRNRVEEEYKQKSALFATTANVYYSSGVKTGLLPHEQRLTEMYNFYMPDSSIPESEKFLFTHLQELNARIKSIYQFIGEVNTSNIKENKEKIVEAIKGEMRKDKTIPISDRIRKSALLEDLVEVVEGSFNFVRDYEADNDFLNTYYVKPLLANVKDSRVEKHLTVDETNRKISTALNLFNLFELKQERLTVSDSDNYRKDKKGLLKNGLADILYLSYKKNNGLISHFRAGNNRYQILTQNIEGAIENLIGMDVTFSSYTDIELVKCGGGTNAKSNFENNIKNRLGRMGAALTYAKVDKNLPYAGVLNRQIDDLKKLLLEDKVSKKDDSMFSSLKKLIGLEAESKTELSEEALKFAYNQFDKKNLYSFQDFKKVFTVAKDWMSRLITDTSTYHIIPELTKTISQTSGMSNLPRLRIDYRMYSVENGSSIGALTFTMHNRKNNDAFTVLINPGVSNIIQAVAQRLKNSKSNITSDFYVPLDHLYSQHLEKIILSPQARDIVRKVNEELNVKSLAQLKK